MKVEEIWNLLEQDQQQGKSASGYLLRRVLSEVVYDVFVALAQPQRTRLVMLQVSTACMDTGMIYPTSSSFEVRRVLLDPNDKTRVTLQLVLTNPRYSDIFTTLAQDILVHLSAFPGERQAVAAFLSRLRRWQKFLEQHGSEGLSEITQQGLYGELWFLRQMAIPRLGELFAVQGWTGPQSTQQDFQFPHCAVEVKTTVAKQHQKLTIASERQLDATGIEQLVLLHLSLDLRQGGTSTLPALVASVRTMVAHNLLAAESLEERLFEAGFLDIHAGLYEQTGYTIREANYFKVEEDFPRIIESDLRNGVGDVRYTISVTECRRFAIPESEVLSTTGEQT
jgi:Putative  PD-(D/E)XK family member, (DUF4420)